MKEQRKTHNRLWVFLLYLALVTSLILSVTLARYSSGAEGTGTATVAAMAGDASSTLRMSLDGMTPGGEDRTLEFQVVNFTADAVSEVALDYRITVETTGNLPLVFTLAADEGENRVAGGTILNGVKSETLTGGAFPLREAGQTHTYTLTAGWPETVNDGGYSREIDLVTVNVEARQRLSGE